MIEIPLPCKLQRNYSSNVNVAVNSYGTTAVATASIVPFPLNETRDFIWVNLSYFEVQQVEYWLAKSRATSRFSYNDMVFLLEDGYEVSVDINRPQIKASFRRVQ